MVVRVFGQVETADSQEVWLPDNPRRIESARTPIHSGSTSVLDLAMVWPTGGQYTFPLVAQPIEIVSDESADNFAGLGGQLVIVFGLDADWVAVTEILPLAGLSPVVSNNSYMRINNILVIQSGVHSSANTGRITVTHQTTGDIIQTIEPTLGFSQTALYSTPADWRLFLHRFHILVADGSPALNVRVKYRVNQIGTLPTDSSFPTAITGQEWKGIAPGVPLADEFEDTIYLPPFSDIWFEAESAGPSQQPGTISIGIDFVQFPVSALRF